MYNELVNKGHKVKYNPAKETETDQKESKDDKGAKKVKSDNKIEECVSEISNLQEINKLDDCNRFPFESSQIMPYPAVISLYCIYFCFCLY